MYDRILVPLDGSTAAEMAIPYAEEIAAKLGSPMILVSVSESNVAGTERLYQAYIGRVAEQVQEQVKNWKPEKTIPVQSRVFTGTPVNQILHYADEIDAGLIVMTSRGASIPGPWLLGHIVGQVLRATDKPLLLVRTPATQSALQRRKLVNRILVPLDGSKLGAAAIPYAETLAQALAAELVLFQVLEPMTSWASYIGGTVPLYQTPQDLERWKALANARLDDAAKPLRGRGISVSAAVLLGTPADQIIDYAKTNSIDLIVMSTHGRTGIGRWVFGNVTDKVLHAGDTAVLVVRPPKA